MTVVPEGDLQSASVLFEDMLMGFIRYDPDIDLKMANIMRYNDGFKVHVEFILKNPIDDNWDDAILRDVILSLPSLRDSHVFRCAEGAARVARNEVLPRSIDDDEL